MLRVVLDTNALVAARWKPGGSAARLMDLCIRGVCQGLVCTDVIRENLDILKKVNPSAAYWDFVHRYHSSAELVTDLPNVAVEEDPADSVFLACALGGKADYLVSSDRHLRAFDGIEGLRIGNASRVFQDSPELADDATNPTPCGNLLEDLPGPAAEEVAETLARSSHVRVERIVSRGQASPADFWYDQPEHEWVLLLQGRAGLHIAGEAAERVLGPGDYVHLPARTRHRVTWTASDETTIWLAVFYR